MSTTTANDDRPRGATPIVENGNNVLLDIKNLRTQFFTEGGVVHAVAVSYTHLTLPTSDLV